MDATIQERTQLDEQVLLYKEHVRHLKTVEVCSLNEYREMSDLIKRATDQLVVNRRKIVALEETIRGTKHDIERNAREVQILEKRLKKYGRLYQFPAKQ